MRYERVKISRDTNTVHNRAVPPWEIPVLEFLFDPGNITTLDEFEEVAGDYPDAATELERLQKVYGSDPKSGIPHALSVFGAGRKGVTELRKLIDGAKTEDEVASKQVKKPAAVKKSRRVAYEPASDSLLG